MNHMRRACALKNAHNFANVRSLTASSQQHSSLTSLTLHQSIIQPIAAEVDQNGEVDHGREAVDSADEGRLPVDDPCSSCAEVAQGEGLLCAKTEGQSLLLATKINEI